MKEAVGRWVRKNPVKVRALVGAVLVAGAQFVPSLESLAGSETAIELISASVVLALGADAARVVAKDKD